MTRPSIRLTLTRLTLTRLTLTGPPTQVHHCLTRHP